jgi:multicomponent K+:H+ antiporter subunit E
VNRILPQPIISATLFVAWLLANNSVAPGHLVLAAVIAFVVPLGTHRFWPEHPRIRSWRSLVRLLAVFLFDVIIANVRVAILILGPTSRLRPRFLRIPLELTSPFSITLLASIISLTPGTVSSNLSADRRTLLVHALDTADEEAAVHAIKQRYERPLLEVFGC